MATKRTDPIEAALRGRKSEDTLSVWRRRARGQQATIKTALAKHFMPPFFGQGPRLSRRAA